ncbi:hypothetical protein WR25_02695 [Diploscapter pachys]|uniref:Uncharacterized protein n=1 Tax=Diploscapter pachys TaxID=2018661 RepID=A0A2A2K1L4_9BILA|nr:hypothetical protein WR25_02695 [Diploscapter pachys]
MAQAVLRLLRQRGEERSPEDSRRDGHDADAIAGEFAGDRQRHADDAALRSGVGGLADLTVVRCDRSRVDHDAALLADRLGRVERCGEFRQDVEAADQVYADDLRERRERQRLAVTVDHFRRRRDPSAVHQDARLAVHRLRFRDGVRDGLVVRDVHADEVSADLPSQRRSRVLVEVEDRDLRTLCGKSLGRTFAKAGRTSGDDRCNAFDVHV